ncbi:AAA family ATPase [Vibrio sp. NTOU-M3]|uniref:AAA family ATPase n=1 Tax=Vibrio sp. NTOU-M3 TaxID=3234954 RepID=UPI00349F57B9
MVKSEYLRFIQTLNVKDVSPNVRKIANLVLKHFDEILLLGTAHGKRVKRVADIASAKWSELSDVIIDTANDPDNIESTIQQLKSIKIGPFRGFSKEENLDLCSLLVLIYGPNGTGKSSFCEALEYGLLGNVAEAETKRFRQQADYLKNAYTNTFVPPQIIGVDNLGNDIPVIANESLYRFCFVEKNRIDSFSRIAAQAPAKQTELISTLFGLEAFNSFAKNFSSEIDGKYIDLSGVKASQLAIKKQSLVGSQQQLKDNNEALTRLDSEEYALAQQYSPGYTFEQMVIELNGNDQSSGAIKKLEIELQAPAKTQSKLTHTKLMALQTTVNTKLSELDLKEKELTNASHQISFKQLYEAVTQLQINSPEQCPACKTPLTHTVVNPYTNASEELRNLQYLANLQTSVLQLNQQITQSLMDISQIVDQTCSRLSQNPLDSFKVKSSVLVTIDWLKSMYQPLPDGFTAWQHLEAQVQQLEREDVLITEANQQREKKQQELAKLRDFAHQITVLQTRRQTTNLAINKANETITNFSNENEALIACVEAEKEVVQRNHIIANAYSTFVQKLIAYKNELPLKLVADLSEKVTELYNAFNCYDAPSEQLAAVQLPLGQSQRLRISYQSDPKKFFDALHVLSEGHIRCIGLAILLAKNINTKSPLLIFDDPVNAIDDEHRKAIREALFKSELFKSKQVILACHGEEFFKDTHQTIGKQAAKNSESYVFKPQKGEKHIQVCSLTRPKNYVLAATELYENAEYRDALMSSRRALEHLCDKAWFHYAKHCDITDKPISVSRRNPQAPWDLRALADNLRSKIKKSKAEIPRKNEIVNALDILLGVGGQDPHWVYLNKGTHEEEDRVEFEHATVEIIVSSLSELEQALD